MTFFICEHSLFEIIIIKTERFCANIFAVISSFLFLMSFSTHMFIKKVNLAIIQNNIIRLSRA